jgi:hypothetical protein
MSGHRLANAPLSRLPLNRSQEFYPLGGRSSSQILIDRSQAIVLAYRDFKICRIVGRKVVFAA